MLEEFVLLSELANFFELSVILVTRIEENRKCLPTYHKASVKLIDKKLKTLNVKVNEELNYNIQTKWK